ncbi:unnamed protein product, partial [Prorocentrum cordatum]
VEGASDHLQAAYQAMLQDVGFSVGAADVKGAFHRMRLPPWMKRLLGLPALKAGDAGLQGTVLDGRVLSYDDVVYPIPEAQPMGCTWGLCLCQSVGRCVYVDNMGVMGQNGELVSRSLDQLIQALGLEVHGREVQSDGVEVLGVVLDGKGNQTRPSMKRLWGVRQGIAGLLQLREVRGDDLRVLLGQCAYIGLVRRRAPGRAKKSAENSAQESAIKSAQNMAQVKEGVVLRVDEGDKQPTEGTVRGGYRVDPGFTEVPSRRVTGKRAQSAGPSSNGTTSESEGANAAKRQRTLSSRVKRRHAAVARAIGDGVPIDRYLEASAVTPRVRAQCQRVLEQLKDRCGRQDFFEMPTETIDACLVHYFISLCLMGEQASTGMYVAVAVNHFYPKYGRLGASSLPRVWKALKGWKRLTPGRSRMPEPLIIWCALMHGLVLQGQRMMAVFLALALSTYLRPSSLFKLRPGDIVKPCAGSPRWGLLMHPQERLAPDKTGEFDLSVGLDSRWLLWLGPLLESMQELDPRRSVWDFDYPMLLRSVRQTCDSLQLRRITQCQARHSGASIDRASGERSQAEVQRRGGWRQLKNMARHEKSARLGQQTQSHSAVLLAYGEHCLRELEPALLWGRAVPRPGGIPRWAK